ncbi:hypothetical protein QYE76_065360 [Lolium multiflorum]|uniref:Uncharacterized protein n=1 Tax=Lolium multiflorum TaxID=4521 RepID=A0AAD8W9X9_LOLMU|nr:hypothetical protein QYE76_065360 [Lolium multiflorum]
MMIKAKNLSGLDTFSVVFALPSGCLWISYGAKLSPHNIFVLVPNAASLAIAVAQIIAFIVFKILAPPPGPVLPILIQPPAPVLPEIELSQMAPVAAGAVMPSVMHADADDLGDTLRGMFQGEV